MATQTTRGIYTAEQIAGWRAVTDESAKAAPASHAALDKELEAAHAAALQARDLPARGSH